MGGASLGSATTTVGSSFFLLFCTLGVFTKLGSIAIAVTFLSILYALVLLPAVLIERGPVGGRGINPKMQHLWSMVRGEQGSYCTKDRHNDTKKMIVSQQDEFSSIAPVERKVKPVENYCDIVPLDSAGVEVQIQRRERSKDGEPLQYKTKQNGMRPLRGQFANQE